MGLLSTAGKLGKKALKVADVGMTGTATIGAGKELARPATKRDALDIAVNPGLNAATMGTEIGLAKGAKQAASRAGAWGSRVVGNALGRAAGKRAAGGLAARALGGMAARAGTAAALGGTAGAYAPLAISAAFAAGETANTIKGAIQLHQENRKTRAVKAETKSIEAEMKKKYPARYKDWKSKR